MTIEILYILASMVAISATIPQLRKILSVKSSKEFSLTTYMTWAGTQSVTLIYVLSINNLLMMITNMIWVGYYLVMIGLIIHYRHAMVFSLAPVEVSNSPDESSVSMRQA